MIKFFGKITGKKCFHSHRHGDHHSKHVESESKHGVTTSSTAKASAATKATTAQKFEADQVRLLVVRDTEQGIKKLFDSRALYCGGIKCFTQRSTDGGRLSEDSGLSSRSCSFSGSNSLSASYAGRMRSNSDRACNVTSDVVTLAEMMFGNVSMKIPGDSLKVHYIRSTNELLLTKVFVHKPNGSTASCSLTDPVEGGSPYPSSLSSSADNSSINGNISRNCSSSSISGEMGSRASTNLVIPSQTRPPSQLSNDSSTGCVGGGYSPCGGGSSSSYNRRLERSWCTSFENGSRLYHQVKRPLEGLTKSTSSCGSGRKSRKIAIGLIFSLGDKKQFSYFEQFFFAHFALIHSHLETLRVAVDDNLHNVNFRKTDWTEFHSNTKKAFNKFVNDFLALFNSPRIQDPVWLTLVTRPDLRKTLCTAFMKEFVMAINNLDTKETKFFLSTLLTAVLTHHCSWIHTVSHDAPKRQDHSKHKSKTLDLLSKTHPYNALWAQLGDLYGAITHPMTVTRTIVVGQATSPIESLLYLLTYFIRCFDVEDICDVEHAADTSSRCSSAISDQLVTPKHDQQFFDSQAPCSFRSGVSLVSPTNSGKIPNPFSFYRAKTPVVSRSRNISASDKESLERSLKSVCSNSVGSALSSSPHVNKSQLAACQKFQTMPSTNSTALLSSGIDLTTTDCSDQAAVVGSSTLSNNTHLDLEYDNLSLHTRSSTPFECNDPSDENSRQQTSSLSEDGLDRLQRIGDNGSGGNCARFMSSSKCEEYLKSCEVCSRSSTPELQCSEECLSNQTCRLMFQTSSQCFIPRYTCSTCDKRFTCTYNNNSSDEKRSTLHRRIQEQQQKKRQCSTEAPSSSSASRSRSSTASSSLRHKPRCSTAVCENPLYMVFDPNCTYTSNRHKSMNKTPQVSTRLPLIWPQNVWESLPPTEEDDNTFVDNKPAAPPVGEGGIAADCTWPYNTDRNLCERGSKKKEMAEVNRTDSSKDNYGLVFPHATDFGVKQQQQQQRRETLGRYRLYSSSSPTSKDSGNGSCTTSRLDDMSIVAIEEDPDAQCDLPGLDFSAIESVPPPAPVCRDTFVEEPPKTPSLLAEQLHQYELAREGGYLGLDNYVNFMDVDLSSCYDLDSHESLDDNAKQINNGLGRSLFTKVSDRYLPDFVLHGTTQKVKDFQENLFEDLRGVVRCSVVDDPVDHAQAIVGNIDDWSVKIVSVSRPPDEWVQDYMEKTRTSNRAASVRSTLKAVEVLWKMNMSAEFCLLHLEDRLQSLNELGILLGTFLTETDNSRLPRNLTYLSKLFCVDTSDLPLLLALASAHSPEVGKILCSVRRQNRSK